MGRLGLQSERAGVAEWDVWGCRVKNNYYICEENACIQN